MTLLKIAFRNVLKNRRRSLITVLAIAFGYMAVVVFRGYTRDAYERMAMGAIFLEGPGHLVFFKEGFLEKGKIDPSAYLLSGEEVARACEILRSDPRVRWVGPKLQITGLATNGTATTIFIADALNPKDEHALWSHWAFQGGPAVNASRLLDERRLHAGFVGPGLGKLLDVTAGDTLVLMATTVDGQMNAIEIEVLGEYPTFADAMDDTYIRLPLATARDLYAFDGADRIGVLVDAKENASRMKSHLLGLLENAGLQMEATTWDELSSYYQQAKSYLDVVFMFLFTIVALIVIMGTVNTMSMAVYERTREVGTLRAIGMRSGQVTLMFGAEGAILGLAGSALGVLMSCAVYALLAHVQITYRPPGVADPVAIAISLTATSVSGLAFLFTSLSAISAWLAVRRIVRKSVVEALSAT